MNSPSTIGLAGHGSTRPQAGAPAMPAAPSQAARWRCLDAQPKGIPMDWDRLQGLLKLGTAKARERWGAFTHDERLITTARRAQFAARIQRRYGVAMAEAERLLVECERNAGDPWFATGRTYR